MVQIAPSMLAADFLHLEKDVELVNQHADIFHLDIMVKIPAVTNISARSWTRFISSMGKISQVCKDNQKTYYLCNQICIKTLNYEISISKQITPGKFCQTLG